MSWQGKNGGIDSKYQVLERINKWVGKKRQKGRRRDMISRGGINIKKNRYTRHIRYTIGLQIAVKQNTRQKKVDIIIRRRKIRKIKIRKFPRVDSFWKKTSRK